MRARPVISREALEQLAESTWVLHVDGRECEVCAKTHNALWWEDQLLSPHSRLWGQFPSLEPFSVESTSSAWVRVASIQFSESHSIVRWCENKWVAVLSLYAALSHWWLAQNTDGCDLLYKYIKHKPADLMQCNSIYFFCQWSNTDRGETDCAKRCHFLKSSCTGDVRQPGLGLHSSITGGNTIHTIWLYSWQLCLYKLLLFKLKSCRRKMDDILLCLCLKSNKGIAAWSFLILIWLLLKHVSLQKMANLQSVAN